MTAAARVVVIGATGFTGGLVAQRLAATGLPFVLCGRNAHRLSGVAASLGGVETRTVDVRAADSLRAALRAGDVVINCAGPFSELGEPVVDAAVRAGAHYLDTTGEQLFMRRVWERFYAPSRAAGVVVANAVAFEYAIGDCAAMTAAEGLSMPLRSIDVVYQWQGAPSASSPGTRRSVLRVLRDGGYVYREGGWRRQRTGAKWRPVRLGNGETRLAVSFPAGEVLTVPRHTDVRNVAGWMIMSRRKASLVPRVAPLLPLLASAGRPLLELALRRAPPGPTAEQRAATRFAILAEAVARDGVRRRVRVAGRDTYGITAILAVAGAERILGGDVVERGVVTPAQVLPPAVLRGVAELAWSMEEDPA